MNKKFRTLSLTIAILLILPIISGCQSNTEKPTNEIVVEVESEEAEESKETEIPEESKEEDIEETTERQKLSIEVQQLKDLVIDDLKPYTAEDGTEVKPEISLPQIVIDYDDVDHSKDEIENFNNQMVEFAKELAEVYNRSLENQEPNPDTTSYEYFESEGFLTILIVRHNNLVGPEHVYENAISIDLENGIVADTDYLLKKKNRQNFIDDLDTVLANELKRFEDLPSDQYNHLKAITMMRNWSQYYGLKPLNEEMESRDKRIFIPKGPYKHERQASNSYIDKDRDLKYSVSISIPAGDGVEQKYISIPESPYEQKYNPAYKYYAEKVGIDLEDANSPLALIGYIGGAGETTSPEILDSIIKQATSKVDEISLIDINGFMDKNSSEFYLIIPKYEDTSMYFYHIDNDHKVDVDTTIMNTVVFTNADGLADNLVRIQHRNKILEYTLLNSNGKLVGDTDLIRDITEELEKTEFQYIENEVLEFFEKLYNR